MKSFFCSLFLLYAHLATAQLADLMKDKNVAWIGESSIDVRLDMLPQYLVENMKEQTQYGVEGDLKILKIQDNEGLDDEGYMVFSHKLFNTVGTIKIDIYSDSLCLHPTDIYSAISNKNDTILMIDPINYEAVYKVPSCPGFIQEVNVFRVHQLVYYNTGNSRWHVKVISIAPLRMVKTKEGKFIRWEPLFWIKVEQKKANLDASDITWAARTVGRSAEKLIDMNTAKEHKKTSNPMLHFLESVKSNKQIPLYQSWREKELLSMDERQNVFTWTETQRLLDPNTNQETAQTLQKSLDEKAVNKLHIVQEWAWDNKRKILMVNILGIAPMKPVHNEAGEFIYETPLFYQRFDD
jgi:Gliding motility associated protein GldN